ncbi:MAG: TonB-dependent receptor [Sphingomicrobium sp.]
MKKSNLRATAALQALALFGAGIAFSGAASAQTVAPSDTTVPSTQGPTVPGAIAQEPTPAPDGNSGEIIVTGSRIANPAAVAPSPVQVVSDKQIRESGAVNIQDVLLENPVFGTPTYSRTNSAFNNSGVGVATVDLRNLGVDRTLVLVNGRRFVSGIPGSNAVDLNVIPTQFLERVDVLTGGASAVYGSDAVAGVVNLIYKTKFDGIQLGSQFGISQYGDGSDRLFNALAGKNFADGRGNIMVFGEYSKQGTVLKRNRSSEAGSSALDSTSLGLSVTGDAADLFTPFRPNFSGFSPRGRYYVPNPNYVPPAEGEETDIPQTITFTYDPTTNALRPCTSRTGGTCDLTGTPFEGSALDGTRIGPDGFNRSDYRYLAVPVQRYVAAMRANYEVSPALNFFIEGNYARTKSATNIEPYPFASDDIFADGQIPVETQVNGVVYRNPFVPDAIFNLATDTNGDGLRDIFVDKRFADFGPRATSVKRDLYRVAGGATGALGSKFNYEVYGIYGQSKEAQKGSGQFNAPNFALALSSFRDVNDVNGNGNTTEILCADPAARAAGCIPANIFGPGSLTPALPYLAAPQSLDTKVTQTVFGGNVGGKLFPILWSTDPISVSVGGEYRKETSRSEFDLLSQGGLNGGNVSPNVAGKFDVYEGFAEAIVPLITDRPFFDRLAVRGAIRRSHYSTVGNVTSFNYGGEWAPFADLRFRVMKARAVRAPNVSELFSPAAEDFPSGLKDPCIGITAASTGTLATNCRAAPGVLANIAANGAFFASQADLQGIASLAGGNPNLGAEKGDTLTIGAVFTPKFIPFLRRTTLTVDYFDIKIKGAIVSTPLQFILDQCYNQSNTSLCNFVVRRPAALGANSAGSLDFVNSGPTNSGGIRTSGIDATFATGHNFGKLETNFRIAYTHLFKGYAIPQPGAPRDNYAGEIGAAQDRFTTNLGFQLPHVGWTLTGTYVGPSFLDDQLTAGFTDANDNAIPRHAKVFRVHSEFYLDSQLRFDVNKKFEFYVGADNLLNNKPPYLADIGADAGEDTLGGTYDPLGRRFYAGVRAKF